MKSSPSRGADRCFIGVSLRGPSPPPMTFHVPHSLGARRRSLIVGFAITALGVLYLNWAPLVPDLAAQVARANVVHDSGTLSWWTGWFGGLSMPNYSVLVPSSMAIFGVRVTGLVAVLGGSAATAILCRDSLRPRAGAIAFAVSAAADLLDGRVTFTAGLAIAAWGLIALRSRRTILTVALAVAAYLASPLAALFLGIIFIAVFLVDATRRRSVVVGAAGLLGIAGGMAVMFPGTGTMPFAWRDAIPAGLCCVAVLVVCRNKLVRTSTVLVMLAFPVFLIVPGAVGANITRLVWVSAAPIVVACASLPRMRLVVATVLIAIWPIGDLSGQVDSATGPSAKAAFYQPLRTALQAQQVLAGAAATGQRIEVVDTANHWGSVYLSTMSLARGWDRQADNNLNPIFYTAGQLNPTSYRSWLDDLAVGWVALPNAPLDYASVAEAKLIQGGLSYLRLSWSTANWKLYRVVDPQPLAQDAQVRSVDSGSVVFTTTAPTTVPLRIRWSPYLAVIDPVSGAAIPSCVIDDNGWVNVVLPRAETVELSSHFAASARLSATDTDCVSDLAAYAGGR